MAEWFATNWTAVLVLLAILVCPLMHAFGHRGRHRGRSPAEDTRR